MLRARRLRQGAHHVNRPALSGSIARPTSMSPAPSSVSNSARSSGRCPMAMGLRSFGCTSISVRAMFMSPQSSSSRPSARSSRAHSDQPRQELELGGIILAAVGDVHRGDHQVAELHLTIRDSWSNGGMAVDRLAGKRLLAKLQRYARITLAAVPERVVVRPRDASGTCGSSAFSSCRQTTSGRSRSSHSWTCAARARMPLTFHVATFTALPMATTMPPPARRSIPVQVRHDPRQDRVGEDVSRQHGGYRRRQIRQVGHASTQDHRIGVEHVDDRGERTGQPVRGTAPGVRMAWESPAAAARTMSWLERRAPLRRA